MSDTTEGAPVFRVTRTLTYEFDNTFFTPEDTITLEHAVDFYLDGNEAHLELPPNARIVDTSVAVLHPEESSAADA